MKNTDLRLQSLSDLNELGEATLTIVRQDTTRLAVSMTREDLLFWLARIEAVLTKAKEANAKKNVSSRN